MLPANSSTATHTNHVEGWQPARLPVQLLQADQGGLQDRSLVRAGLILEVMTRLRAAGASVALVTDGTPEVSGSSVRGLITKQQIASAVIDGMELFAA